MTDIIDINIHGSAFPSTYIGSGNVIGNPRFAPTARLLALAWTGTGNALNISLGNEPLRIKVINETDTIIWEWERGMGATKTIKTTGTPTVAVDTTSAIVVSGDVNNGNFSVALSAALNASAKALTAVIEL